MTQDTKHQLRKTARLVSLVIALAIAVLSLMPSQAATSVPGNDKLLHLIACAALAAPMMVWLGRQSIWRVFVLALGYGVLMELAQALVPTGREASVLDVLANALGAGIGTGFGMLALRVINRN